MLDDLLEENEMLFDSQESLTIAAANLVCEDSSDEMLDDLPSTPATSQESQDAYHSDSDKRDSIMEFKPLNASRQPQTVLEQIEDIFDQITRTLADHDDVLTVRLRVRPAPDALKQSGSMSKAVSSAGRSGSC